MPQNNPYLPAKTPSNVMAPLLLDQYGQLRANIGGTGSTVNITAATVVKASPGVLVRVSVIVAGSAAGTVNDAVTTGAAAAANQIGTIPATLGTYVFEWPCSAGIVVVPGTGQTLAVAYA